MIRDDLAAMIQAAAEAAIAAGELPQILLPEIVIERPARPEHGDYATNLPLRLARAARANPLDLAKALAARIPVTGAISSAEAAPPGFINFRLSEAWLARQVDRIVEEGDAFGNVPLGGGKKVQVEFVSANPTGPLTAGNGRGAAIGSVLASVLEAAGYAVEREYLVNDAGTQTEVFGRTLIARYLQLFGKEIEIPADGYPGEYMIDVAKTLRDEFGDRFAGAAIDDPPQELVLRGVDLIVERIQADLLALRVKYDVWYRERSVYEDGDNVYDRSMQLLRDKGYLVEKEGALWFASTELGEDKDNVVIRSTGRPTYFASDIAYHYDKFVVRGFDRVIDVWGADHQGHVSRMKAAVEALGVEPARLDILIYQLVSFRRGEEVVRLSKRAGNIVLIRDVVDEVGADAARFFFLARSADSQMEFDLELAKRQSAENPVYYVQYAHARIAGILAKAAERIGSVEGGDVALLTHPAELELVRKMLQLPELVQLMATNLEPHHLPHYAQELATAFHAFYTECRVMGEDVTPELTKARLRLCTAARTTLARALTLMGMTTPDHM
ncbi:MAG: arginine--tRNA ligase [Dehalococcoidia bacterium]|nr:MAG: arginine--tRNA ligase [Dehalococcoidia bacterium]